VKARDLAGNEDPTPASRSFSVRLGPVITSITAKQRLRRHLRHDRRREFRPRRDHCDRRRRQRRHPNDLDDGDHTTVPMGVSSGPATVAVTSGLGVATAPFTVALTGDFTLTALPVAPGAVTAIAGDQVAARLNVGGTGTFTSLASLSVYAAIRITASFSPQLVAPGNGSFLTFAVGSSVSPATYTFTVTAQAQIDGHTETRTAQVALTVLASDTREQRSRASPRGQSPIPCRSDDRAQQRRKLSPTLPATSLRDFARVSAARPPQQAVAGRTTSLQRPIRDAQGTGQRRASGRLGVPFTIFLPAIDTRHPISLGN